MVQLSLTGVLTATPKAINTQQALNSIIWSACDIMRRSNCASALQYVPEITWILFLRILDDREKQGEEDAATVGQPYAPSLAFPYRWQDWAAPTGAKRQELRDGALGAFFTFVNANLLPHLRGLRDRPNATPRQKIISEIMSGVEHVRIDTEHNLLDVLDKINTISIPTVTLCHRGRVLEVGEVPHPVRGHR